MGNSIALSGGTAIGKSQLIGVGEACRLLGLCANTVRKMDRDGILPAYRYANGHRRWLRKEVMEYASGEDDSASSTKVCLIYCRVSSSRQAQEKKDRHGESSSDLKRQVERMQIEARERYPELKAVVYSETGSGMNYERKILNRLLDEVLEGKWNDSVLLVENRDRLVRFAADLCCKIFNSRGIEVIYTAQEDATADQDFSSDVLACIHYFSTRLYSGRQAERNRAQLSAEVITKAKQQMDMGIAVKTVARNLTKQGYRTESGGNLTYAILYKHVYQRKKELSKTVVSVESSAKTYKRECIEETTGDYVVPIHRVYDHYKAWAEKKGLVVVSKRLFGIEFPFAHQAWIRTEGRQWRSWRGFIVKGENLHEFSPEKAVVEETPKEHLLRFARTVSPYRGSQLGFVKKYRAFCDEDGRIPLTRPTVVKALTDMGWWNQKKHDKNQAYLLAR